MYALSFLRLLMGKIQLFYNKNCLLLLIFITYTLENMKVIAPINTLNNNIDKFNGSPRIADLIGTISLITHIYLLQHTVIYYNI
jgi:hypothetical protein